MNIVKGTDPSTVTQHGLYMRPLTEPSLHPLVAKPSPQAQSSSLDDPVRPVTPARETEEPSPAKLDLSAAKTDLSPANTDPVSPKTDLSPSNKESSPGDTAPVAQAEQGVTAQHSTQVNLQPAGAATDNFPAAVLPLVSDQPEDTAVTGSNLISGAHAAAAPKDVVPTPEPAKKGSDQGAKGTLSTDEPASKGPEQAAAATADNLTASAKSEVSERVPEVVWGKGRVSLLGDAAHATIPNGTLPPVLSLCYILCSCYIQYRMSSPNLLVECLEHIVQVCYKGFSCRKLCLHA